MMSLLAHQPLASVIEACTTYSAWVCGSLNNSLHAQVARCTKIIKPGTEEAKYVINVKQIAKV